MIKLIKNNKFRTKFMELQKITIYIQIQKMSCSHKFASNSKDCCICRIKRAVNIEQQRILNKRGLRRHQSQEAITIEVNKQNLILNKQPTKNTYFCNMIPTENNFTRWIHRIQGKRLQTLPQKKSSHPQINWGLFQLQKHRPKFDRWQNKLLSTMMKNGKADLLLKKMCLS